jgi:hypothetical protein
MKLFTYKLPFFGRIEAIDSIAICEPLLLSKVSVSEDIEYRSKRRGRRPNNDDNDAITTTTMTTTTKKALTPYQAQQVLLIGRLRELVINGHSPLAIQAELGISQRQYYRLYQKAFEHDCKLIEQWDSDTLKMILQFTGPDDRRFLRF